MKAEVRKSKQNSSLNVIRHEIQRVHLILIIVITILLSLGGAFVNVNANDNAFDQNLQDTAELITRIYGFMRNKPRQELRLCMDSIGT